MKCPKCKAELKKVYVEVEGAENKVRSLQCKECGYVEFEPKSSAKIVKELKAKSPLKIKQKIIKLSKDRLGMYLNKNIVESLNLKSGETIYISVPDKKHILVEVE